jgi:hypothetical protein
MPKIKVEVEHTINQELALSRVKGLLNKLKNDYQEMFTDLNEEWTSNGSKFSFKVMGMKVKGNLNITSLLVCLDGEIPLAALPFKRTIEDKIREETLRLLK